MSITAAIIMVMDIITVAMREDIIIMVTGVAIGKGAVAATGGNTDGYIKAGFSAGFTFA